MADDKQQVADVRQNGRNGRWYRFRRSTTGSILINMIAAVVVIALIQSFFVKIYEVPSGSMQATLQIGDKILVNRTAYAGDVPRRGDVVVFAADKAWKEAAVGQGNPAKELVRYFGDVTSIGPSHEKFLVKRVIGIPGDVVDCCSKSGVLQINDVRQQEPYVHGNLAFERDGLNCETTPKSFRCFGPFEVPDGQLLVLGDNRGNSNDSVFSCRGVPADSSCLKLVPVENVIGHVFSVVFPASRIGSVH